MLERAKGQFKIEGTVEDIFGGISGAARIARISQTCIFTGQLEGESIAEYTAVLPREGEGSLQGFQRISGKLGEREGTFVIAVTGTYLRGEPRGRWVIVPKSGSGDLQHIRGEGEFEHSAGKPATYRLEFDLRKPRAARTAAEVADADGAAAIEQVELLETVAEPMAEIEQPAKPSRRAKPKPAIEPAPETPAQVAKSTRRKKTSMVAAAEPEPVISVEPPRKRPRKKPDTKPLPVSVDVPAPVATKPTRRKKSEPVKEAPPVEPAPSRRKPKPASAEPALLPVAQAKPPRQRRKAA